MSNPNFLNIDDSITTRNLLLPNTERDALNQQMDELMKQLDTKQCILVQPTPGVCVKTKTISGEKFFVNICVSDKIPPPKDISDAELFELINHEVPTYTIPLSIGNERTETDKSGASCGTCDVMMNSGYLKKCQEKKHFMAFTVLVVLNGVSEKHDKGLKTEEYVILKNRTVIGKLQQHKIQNRDIQKVPSPEGSKPMIEEISCSTKSVDKKVQLQDSGELETGYVILRKPQEGPVERLIALFDMPKSISIEDVMVLVNSDRINVTDEKACHSYDVLLPYRLKVDNAKAFLDYNLRVLRVDILIDQE